jgi:hypothetical protein
MQTVAQQALLHLDHLMLDLTANLLKALLFLIRLLMATTRRWDKAGTRPGVAVMLCHLPSAQKDATTSADGADCAEHTANSENSASSSNSEGYCRPFAVAGRQRKLISIAAGTGTTGSTQTRTHELSCI